MLKIACTPFDPVADLRFRAAHSLKKEVRLHGAIQMRGEDSARNERVNWFPHIAKVDGFGLKRRDEAGCKGSGDVARG